MKVGLGQHTVVSATDDGLDKAEKNIEVEAAGQFVTRLALKPVRDARRKAEQEARDKAAQEAIPGPDQVSRQDIFSEQNVRVVPARKATISPGVAVSLLVKKTAPSYPAVARAARLSGTVVIQATISKTGEIGNLQVVSGPPLLRQAALDSVKTWRFRPYMLEGEPVDVDTTFNVTFALAQ